MQSRNFKNTDITGDKSLDIDSKLELLHNKVERTSSDLQDIKIVIEKLADIQKATTENIKSLTSDIHDLLKTSIVKEIHQKELEEIDKRLKVIENNKIMVIRLFLGTFITIIIGVVVKLMH